MLEKTLESPLDCKEIQPVHPKGDQSRPFSPPDRDRRGDSPAWSGRGSRPSRSKPTFPLISVIRHPLHFIRQQELMALPLKYTQNPSSHPLFYPSLLHPHLSPESLQLLAFPLLLNKVKSLVTAHSSACPFHPHLPTIPSSPSFSPHCKVVRTHA